MPKFLLLGQIWINADLIELVQVAAHSDAEKPIYEIHFMSGRTHTFSGEDGQKLVDYLIANHVTVAPTQPSNPKSRGKRES